MLGIAATSSGRSAFTLIVGGDLQVEQLSARRRRPLHALEAARRRRRDVGARRVEERGGPAHRVEQNLHTLHAVVV